MGKQSVSYWKLASSSVASRQLERFLQITFLLFVLGVIALGSTSWAFLQRSLELDNLGLGLVAVGFFISSFFFVWMCHRAVQFERLIKQLKSDWWQAVATVAELKEAPSRMEGTIDALNNQIRNLEEKIDRYKDGLDKDDPLGRISFWREKYISLQAEIDEGIFYEGEREAKLFQWIAKVSGQPAWDIESRFSETGYLPPVNFLSDTVNEVCEVSDANVGTALSNPESPVNRFERVFASWPEHQAEIASFTIRSMLRGVPLDLEDISTKLEPAQLDQLIHFLKEIDLVTGQDTGVRNFLIGREAGIYHEQIDSLVDATSRFLSDTPWNQSGSNAGLSYDLQTVAVFVTHLATLMAIDRDFLDNHRITFNGFTRSLAFRTQNNMPDIEPPENMLISYLSSEESFMQDQIEQYHNIGHDKLLRNLLVLLGVDTSQLNVYTLRRFLDEASITARETFLLHLENIKD